MFYKQEKESDRKQAESYLSLVKEISRLKHKDDDEPTKANYYAKGYRNGIKETLNTIIEALEEQKIEILEKYNKFLIKNNYADDDLWNEKPTAIERFLEEK